MIATGPSNTKSGNKTHLVQLTSLRGIACLFVLFGHVVQVFNYGHQRDVGFANTLRILCTSTLNAEAAVRLFFVLSGCVLSLSLLKSGQMTISNLLAFYVKRAFRIYPMLWLSLPLAVLSVVELQGTDGSDYIQWLARNLQTPVSMRAVLLSLAGIFTRFNGPMWSLRIEIIWSILFPLLIVLLKTRSTQLATIVSLFALALLPVQHEFGLSFGFAFALGALIPIMDTPRQSLLGTLIAVLILIYCRPTLSFLGLAERYFDLTESVASFAIVLDLYASGRQCRLLGHPTLVRLGDWSYGVYLLHLPILLLEFAAMRATVGSRILIDAPIASQTFLGVSVASLTLALAFGCHHSCELPLQRLGRRLSLRLIGAAPDRPSMVATLEGSET